jgi:hypothetical protein
MGKRAPLGQHRTPVTERDVSRVCQTLPDTFSIAHLRSPIHRAPNNLVASLDQQKPDTERKLRIYNGSAVPSGSALPPSSRSAGSRGLDGRSRGDERSQPRRAPEPRPSASWLDHQGQRERPEQGWDTAQCCRLESVGSCALSWLCCRVDRLLRGRFRSCAAAAPVGVVGRIGREQLVVVGTLGSPASTEHTATPPYARPGLSGLRIG